MAKGKTATVYFCQECGNESTKWMGQCPACKAWNSLVEETISLTVKNKNAGMKAKGEVRLSSLSEIDMTEEEKIKTHIEELDRVLGGGVVPGSLTLVGGDPGIGKSTLLLQVCRYLSADKHKVLYISGEESLKQIKMRANRIGSFEEEMQLLCETDLAVIEEVIGRYQPQVVVIDSIQTMYQETVSSAPGSVSQVREAYGGTASDC